MASTENTGTTGPVKKGKKDNITGEFRPLVVTPEETTLQFPEVSSSTRDLPWSQEDLTILAEELNSSVITLTIEGTEKPQSDKQGKARD